MAGFYELKLDEEGTTSLEFLYEVDDSPVDLTGYTAQATGRRSFGTPTTEFDLTSGGGEIVLGGTAGTIQCTWTDEITDAITVNKGQWELVVTSSGGARYSLLKGPYTLGPKVVN